MSRASQATEPTSGHVGSGNATDNQRTALVVAFEGRTPLAGASRHDLTPTSRVFIQRGDRSIEREGRTLTITLPDPRVSGQHAMLELCPAGWLLRDLGSTNGTLVNGSTIKEWLLQPDDVIEVGHNILIFAQYSQRHPLSRDVELRGQLTPFSSLNPFYDHCIKQIQRIAASPATVLLLGETGTGKEVLARAIHEASGRPGEFVAVNCGAIPENLMESQLFGHLKGAFSGAASSNDGFVRASHRGTLLLDEVGELPAASQAVLLRTLQSGEVVPLGSTRPHHVDLRVLAATHQPLEELVEAGAFRRDLYARLAGFVFHIPPLRQRKEDLGLLIGELLRRDGGDVPSLRGAAARALFLHEYPMNVRELEQALATARILAEEKAIDVPHLPAAITQPKQAKSTSKAPSQLSEADEQLREELVFHLRSERGNLSAVARSMGKARQQIQRWVRRFELDPEQFREP